MTAEELQLWAELSARLPYKMKFQSPNGIQEMSFFDISKPCKVLVANRDYQSEPGFNIHDIKPILFPLSDITKIIEFGGNKVNLMKELACIFDFDGYQGYYTSWKFDENKGNVVFSIWGGEICRMNLKSFMVTNIKNVQDSTNLGLIHFDQVFSLFHRYHIDYHGLIDKGQAMSVHELRTNPYK